MDSSVITSRVKDDVKRKLENECELKNLTLNTLVSQILSRHTDWGRFANEAGFVYLTKEDAKAFLELIPNAVVIPNNRGIMRKRSIG